MKNSRTFLSPGDVFDQRTLSRALKSFGDYVYGYFRPRELYPFYVGKGSAGRVLAHWKNAFDGKTKLRQCGEIEEILNKGEMPIVKILAYNLDKTRRNEVYNVVERVLQNTFGIEREKAGVIGFDRDASKRTLVQYRDDGSKYPPLALEAAFCKGAFDEVEKIAPRGLAEECGAPVLLVGLSRSYQPSYSQVEVSEMARMWWDLDKFENTTFPSLRESSSAVLAAWTSKFGGPQIAGIWRIKKGTFKKESSGRYMCAVENDFPLRRKLLGRRLQGTGRNFQGPHIILPE